MFTLAYGSGGAFSAGDIERMGRADRDAYIDLLIEQKKAEEDAARAAQRKAKRR